MNKFLSNLTKDNKSLKESRATMLATQAERAKKKIVDTLQDELDQQEYNLERLNDLSPASTTSLKYRDDFNPTKWAEDTFELEKTINLIQMELEIAKFSFDTNFSHNEE
jgi:Rad3-related DNA helicase